MNYLNVFVGLIYLAVALRLWWELADWSNDIYVLTNSHVIDIEKKPLYFAEKRNQIELAKIQSLSFTQQGLINTLFKMGDIKIEASGGEPIIFRRVQDPHTKQQRIFEQMDKVKSEAKKKETDDKTKEYTKWFDAYHNTYIRVN